MQRLSPDHAQDPIQDIVPSKVSLSLTFPLSASTPLAGALACAQRATVTGQQCAGGVGSRRAAEDQVMPARKPVSSFRPTSFSFPCARTQDVNVADTGTTQAPGSHPQPFPISSFPYTTPFPVRYQSPPPHPNSSFACSAPPACDLPALVPALSFFPEAEKVPSGPWNHRSLQGSIYPTGTRFHIPDFSLISGSPGDKASTVPGPVTRVTCLGNQDSLRLVPAWAVACRA
jgi:hypothetical protein